MTVAAFAAAIGAAPARADDPKDTQVTATRELFIAATKDEQAGRFAEALEKLRKVVVLKPTAGVRFHIANCEEGIGQLVKALDDYSRAETQARPGGRRTR